MHSATALLLCRTVSVASTPQSLTQPMHLQGVIQHSTINNLAFGRNIEETQRVLQALKYVQVGEAALSHLVYKCIEDVCDAVTLSGTDGGHGASAFSAVV